MWATHSGGCSYLAFIGLLNFHWWMSRRTVCNAMASFITRCMWHIASCCEPLSPDGTWQQVVYSTGQLTCRRCNYTHCCYYHVVAIMLDGIGLLIRHNGFRLWNCRYTQEISLRCFFTKSETPFPQILPIIDPLQTHRTAFTDSRRLKVLVLVFPLVDHYLLIR